MASDRKTLGQAIDEIVAALDALDEKARPTAIAAACAHLGLSVPTGDRSQSEIDAAVQPPALQQQQSKVTDIRSLKEGKQPSNAIEMACVVAFYLQNEAPAVDRKETINAEDVTKYFKQGAFPLPKRVAQLLVDTKHAGYFDSAERGAYRLNAVGHNLVAHSLPRQAKTGRK